MLALLGVWRWRALSIGKPPAGKGVVGNVKLTMLALFKLVSEFVECVTVNTAQKPQKEQVFDHIMSVVSELHGMWRLPQHINYIDCYKNLSVVLHDGPAAIKILPPLFHGIIPTFSLQEIFFLIDQLCIPTRTTEMAKSKSLSSGEIE